MIDLAVTSPPAPRSASARPPLAVSPRWPRVGLAIVLLLVPLLLLALPLPPTRGKWAVHKQDWIAGAAGVVAALALAAYLVPTRLFPQRKSPLPLILLGTAVLVLANVGWNKAFRAYGSAHPEYRREVFRNAMRTSFHSPVYGRYDNAIARFDPGTGRYGYATLPFVWLSLALAGAAYAWFRRRPLDKRWDAKDLALLAGFTLALIVAFALCEPWPDRLSLKISGYNEFKKDIPAFAGIADTMRNYVSRMPTLEWYGQHYPPGNLILLEIEKAIRLPGLAKGLVALLTALSVVPLVKLAEELRLDAPATSAAAAMFAMSTSVLVLCTINTTSLLLFPATLCLWTLARALRTGSIEAAAWLGFSFFVYLFFSFSASIVGVLMALTTLLAWWAGVTRFRNIVATAVASLAVLVGCVALLNIATGFNLIECFVTAVRGHQDQQGNGGFDDARRWLLRSTGNVLAYLISTVPLCVLAIAAFARNARRLRDDAGMARSLFVALVVTIVLAGFSGLFYVETERIWIFLTPALALAAGHELARRSVESDQRRMILWVVLLVLAISCSQEFLFMHYR